jgi:hypothetical protein
MAEKLLEYYKYVAQELGLQGKTQLAMRTRCSSVAAAVAPDTPARIEEFRRAVTELTGRPAPTL